MRSESLLHLFYLTVTMGGVSLLSIPHQLSFAGDGVPGKFCTSGGETNWYGRSLEWHEGSGIVLSRS